MKKYNKLSIFDYCFPFFVLAGLLVIFAAGCSCHDRQKCDCENCPAHQGDDDTQSDDSGGGDDDLHLVDDTSPPVDDDASVDIEYLAGGMFSGAAVAMDDAGKIYVVSAKSRHLRVYEKTSDEWSYQVAEFGVYANPSAAAGPDGTLHIVSYDWFKKQLRMAEGSGAQWTHFTLDQDGDVGHYSSLVLDSGGFVHTAYDEESSRTPIGVRYATNATGAWTVEHVTTGTGVGAFPAIATDAAGTPYISYDSVDEIRLARKNGAAWESQALPFARPFRRASGLAFDSGDALHVIYQASDESAPLRYATGSYDSLASEIIPGTGNVGDTVAMTIDGGDVVHFIYYDETAAGAVYGRRDGSGWIVQALGSGYPVFVAARSADDVAITLGGLGVYRKNGGGFVQEYFDRGYSVQDTVLAEDSQGKFHAVFFENTNQALYHADNSSGSWTVEVVKDVIGEGAENIGLALDAADAVHICFYNGLTFNLNHATNEDGEWKFETVDEDNFTGTHCAMTARGDVLHVSYYDSAVGRLKYARREAGSWSSFVVDASGLVGSWSDIAVDAAGVATIVYPDLSNNDVKLATGGGSVWTTEIVDAEGGAYVSGAVGPDGRVHVGYVGGGLRHAWKENGEWKIRTVDEFALEAETDMVITAADEWALAYQSLDWNLSLAKQSSGAFRTFIVDELGDVGEHVSMIIGADHAARLSYVSHDAVWLATVY